MVLARNTMTPHIEQEISQAEYERWIDQGILYDGTPPVAPADGFDVRMAVRLSDPESAASAAARAAFVPFWTAGEAVAAGAVRLSPVGETIIRGSPGTTGASYDAAEAAAWTVVSEDVAAADISDSTTTGRALLTAADAASARTAIGAGTSSFSGAYADLIGQPTIPDSPDDIGAAPAAHAHVTDHGTLTGLSDDDHAQYALADGTRGAFAAPIHTHDDRYFTESETLAAQSVPDLWIPAQQFTAQYGTPALTTMSDNVANTGTPVWLLDAATQELLSTVVRVPEGWTNADVVLWWMNVGAGAGAVQWRFDHNELVQSAAIPTNDTADTQLTVPALGQWVIEQTVLKSGIPVSPSALLRLELYRFGAHSADTLANDAGVIGVTVKQSVTPTGWTKS